MPMSTVSFDSSPVWDLGTFLLEFSLCFIVGGMSRGDQQNGKCLLCQGAVAVTALSISSFHSWGVDCAKSLCEVFLLEDSYTQYFEAVKYCNSCQDLVRNIDFTQRALKKLSKLLSTYRDSYKSLLRVEYSYSLSLSTPRSHSRKSRRNNMILHKLHQGIITRDPHPTTTETSDRPNQGQERSLKKKSVRRKLCGTDDESSGKKPRVVQYTSKYGRACTSIRLIDSDCDSDGQKSTTGAEPASAERESEHVEVAEVEMVDAIKEEEPNLWLWPIIKSVSSCSPLLALDPRRSLREWKRRKLEPGREKKGHGITKEILDSDADAATFKSTASNPRQKFNCKETGCSFSCYKKPWLKVHVRSRHGKKFELYLLSSMILINSCVFPKL